MTDNVSANDTNYAEWIGRSETAPRETLTRKLVERFRATLDPHLAATDGAPAGIHWCLSPPVVPTAQLGSDGHPAKGVFLPPVPLPRRMWAGAQVEFMDPLREGDSVARVSRIVDVAMKQGRSGPLCFVSVQHDLTTPRGVALREWHDIVYRPAATQTETGVVADTRDEAAEEHLVPIDPVLLFRYSAITFNGHRIHYDESYAKNVEFYPGLVIHGPLQATLMLNHAVRQGGKFPRRFVFRGISPACGAQVLRLRAWPSDTGLDLATVTDAGVTAMKATAIW